MKKEKKSDLWALRPNLYDYLKVLAIVTMIIDHIWYYLFPEILTLRLIGRVAFPIFLFLVWFNGSYKWRWSLFFSAVSIQLMTILLWIVTGAWNPFYLNILFSILLTRALLYLLSKFNWTFWSILGISLLIWLSLTLPSGFQIIETLNHYIDYGVFWFLFGLSGFFLQQGKKWISGLLVFSLLLFYSFFHLAVHNFWFSADRMKITLGVEIFFICVLITLLAIEKHENKSLSLKTYSFLDQVFLFISQNALWIYVIHLTLLMILFYFKYKTSLV